MEPRNNAVRRRKDVREGRSFNQDQLATNRRIGLAISAAATLLMVSLLAATSGHCAEPPRRPNIVFILADDMGWGDPGCYNPDSKIPTPFIDRVAREGMRFTDAHCPSAVCTPTRYGLLTGRYPWRTKLKSGVLWGYSPALIEPGRATLASFLADHGYATAGIGKWHLGLGDRQKVDYAQPLRPGPSTVGFAYYFGIPASLDMDPYVWIENDHVLAQPTEHDSGSRSQREGGGGFWRAGLRAPGFRHEDVLPKCIDHAVTWLVEQPADKPLFLYLALTAPHDPWVPTREYQGRSQAGWYGDFVAQVDASIGRVLAALDEHGLSENTLLFIASDNGAHCTPADIERHGHHANGPWRGQKADIWEGGHRVPFMVRWPGHVAAGSTSDQLICLTDLMATVAELLDVPLPDDAAEDSIGFASALLGHESRAPPRETLVVASVDGTLAIRQGPWKLCRVLGSHGFSQPATIKPAPDGPEGQLYNLADDPGEEKNVWLDEPKQRAVLEALLWLEEHQGPRWSRRAP